VTKEELSEEVRAMMGNIKVSSASREELASKMRVLHFAYTLCEKAHFEKGGNMDLQFSSQTIPKGHEDVYGDAWHSEKSQF
jgi:hypothetical protein